MSCKIITLNVRGIGDAIKRRSIFNYYKTRGDILCLQETHSTPDVEKIWNSEFGGDGYYSHGTASSTGVCILLKKSVPFRVVKNSADLNGRIVVCELESIDDPTKRFTICSIYGPNKDKPHFYIEMLRLTANFSTEQIYIGDFNLVLDVGRDRKNSFQNNWQSHATLTAAINELDLVDIWRVRNPEKELYTWMRAKPKYVASRIDFALVTQGLTASVQNTMYLPGIHTDHMAQYVLIDLLHHDRGKGYWKLNTTLLKQKDFVQQMNDLIDSKLRESAAMTKVERWMYLKKECSDFAKQFSRNRVKERDLIISQLSEKILEMEHKISKSYNDKDYKILENSKTEIEELLLEKARGTIFRTKANWYEQSETSSRYFYNLEKRRYNSRVCNKVIDENSKQEIDKPEDILEAQRQYFQDLYRSDPKVSFKLANTYGVKVPPEHPLNQNEMFTKFEVANALKGLSNGKTPGEDGISPEFYKMFFLKLGEPLHEMITEIFNDKNLPEEISRAIINLIPKANKDTSTSNLFVLFPC